MFGLLFGLPLTCNLKNLPVHNSMLEISELIYETCKTYLITQGKFLLLLWIFIAVIIAPYFGWLALRREISGSDASYHFAVQPDRHRGQLWRGLVRHSCEYVRQLAHGVRQPDAARRIPAIRFR